MGIIYTITNFFQPALKLTENGIKVSSRKLTLNIKNQQYKLQQQIFQLEESLLKMFKQIPLTRSKDAQTLQMIQLIKNSEKIKVYQQVTYSLAKIQNQAYQLQVEPTKVSSDCVVAISSLIYVYEPLELQQYINLNDFIPQPHPDIGIDQISPPLKKYLKKQQVTHYELNLYVCELLKRQNISIGVINMSGHSFVPNPLEPTEVTPSYEAFAVSYEYNSIQQQ